MTMTFIALLIVAIIALVLGAGLGFAAIKFKVESDPLVEQIDNILPQTQCGQCGYPGCRPYAEAIANGDEINKCPPGGEATIKDLASLMGVEAKPLDSAHGVEDIKKVAYIREDECIGCTKCIQACPVDAIVGAAKQMHTVIIDECTGCDLCVDPCPVDCIDMLALTPETENWQWDLQKVPVGDIQIKVVN
ncbi:electron transport complex subunit RsxB [Glaciecola petra]|uniref:Ion-translocating oxidoreductase complex subunit B n=1 Tax=Glaciecola petra TaxID=3075602 RepID=A0ABU2ZMT2_9ALTE|nr:electron transport complex subunit RsxB [Aestuariibacter sp. P117]MDT0593920.1 electron transport complex subunit RsxB [Aestuariibacter sp. P117]